MDDNVELYKLLGGEMLQRTSATAMDLPPPETKRWVARRKAVIVNAVRSGAITLEEVAAGTNSRWKNSSLGSARSKPAGSQGCASPGYRSIAILRRPGSPNRAIERWPLAVTNARP
jgi:uncharacterized protein DUF1153